MPQYYSQNIAEKVQCHMGHFVSNGGRSESTRCEHNHNKSVRMQTEYLGTRKTRFILHGVPFHIEEDYLGAFFARYRQVSEVERTRSRVGIVTVGVALLITLTRKSFSDIPMSCCVADRIF